MNRVSDPGDRRLAWEVAMANTRSRRRWTAAEAEGVVEAWRASGQSMRAFARQRGFDVQRLGWWKKRLAEWSGGDARV